MLIDTITNKQAVGSYITMYPVEYILPRLYKAYRLVKGRDSYLTWIKKIDSISVHYSVKPISFGGKRNCDMTIRVYCLADYIPNVDNKHEWVIEHRDWLEKQHITYTIEVFTNERGFCSVNTGGMVSGNDFKARIGSMSTNYSYSAFNESVLNQLGVELHAPVSKERINFVLRVDKVGNKLQNEWQ